MDDSPPRYDDLAVGMVVEIDEHLVRLASPLDQRTRRCRMIRAAIEGQIEYYDPPPDHDVLHTLAEALLRQAKTLDADTTWLADKLACLKQHVIRRAPS